MHSNSEGLSPSLRAQLGVGWNRALPAPFGFDNGIVPDGVNDALIARGLVGQQLPDEITYTCWIKTPTVAPGSNGAGMVLISTLNATGLKVYVALSNSRIWTLAVEQTGANESKGSLQLSLDTYYYIETYLNFSDKSYRFFVNTIQRGSGSFSFTADPFANPIQYSGLFFIDALYGAKMNFPHDECILYNRALSQDERVLNYNNGVGNNPSKTEGILWWYKFEKAESDVILNPGGNPAGWPSGAWGVRDHSPNGYHAQQAGMVNNETLGGAIQAF